MNTHTMDLDDERFRFEEEFQLLTMKSPITVTKYEKSLEDIADLRAAEEKCPAEIEAGVKQPTSLWRYFPQCLAVFSASLAFFSRGLHQAWTSPALPKLLLPNTTDVDFQISTDQGSWIVTSYSASISIGAPVAAFLIHTIGRKQTILASAVPHLVAFLLIAVATSVEWLYVARLLAGFSEGLTNLAVPAYVGEVAEPKIRGLLSCVYTIVSMFGILLINVIGSYTTIFQTSIICAIFPILLMGTFLWMPESPYFYLMRNKRESAKRSLQRLRGRQHAVDEELKHITQTVDKQMLNVGTFTDLFTIRSNRRAFQLAIALETVQQFSGISAIQSYAQIIFIISGQQMSSEMSSILLMSVQLVMSAVGASFVDRLGRRPLLMFSCAGCCLTLFLEGLYFYLQYIHYQHLDTLFWLPLVALIGYFVVYSAGLAIIINVYAGETFSTSVKGKAMALTQMWYGVLSFFVSKLFQRLLDDVGMFVPFWMFAAASLLGLIYTYLYVPETKGKTMDEIQDWFSNN